MMSDYKLPRDIKVRVRTYYLKSKHLLRRQSHIRLIEECLSGNLTADVQFCISKDIFSNVWWLNGCDGEFIADLAVRVHQVAFAPRELIYSPDTLFIITSGFAWRVGKMLAKGDNWGDIILSTEHLRDTRKAKSLGFCEISKLARSSLMQSLNSFPESAKMVQEAAVKLAFTRAMLIVSLYWRVKKSRRTSFTNAMGNLNELSSGSKGPGGKRGSVAAIPNAAAMLRANSEWKIVKQRKQKASDMLERVNDLLELDQPWREVDVERAAVEKAAADAAAIQRAATADEEEASVNLKVGTIVRHA
eukprot:3934635-Prymnesium_polylepis.2